MSGKQPFFAVELRFKDSVTVIADNGFEQVPLRVTLDKGGCSGRLEKATLFGDIAFTLQEDGQITLMDTAWTKRAEPSVFGHSAIPERRDWSFREQLNACIFGHVYKFYRGGKAFPGRIELLPNGQMNGLRPYMGYTLCFAGDCREEADPPSPTITFLSDTGELVTYAMSFADAGHQIRFYPLSPPLPDEKGARKLGELAFEWVAE